MSDVAPASVSAPSAASRSRDRLTNLGWAGLIATPLFIATRLKPDISGVGTHRQLGLPPCAFYYFTGIPCPFCGMTTSWTWAAHGHPLVSFRTQPMGFVFFLCAIALTVAFAFLSAIGAPAVRPERVLPRVPRGVWWTAVALIAIAWVYKALVLRGIIASS